jgi:Suppressor of fused protein (SUFU)
MTSRAKVRAVSRYPSANLSEEEWAGIEASVKATFGEYDTVWHEIHSTDVHLDLIAVPPSTNPDVWITTMGMSAAEMNAPEGAPKFAELCIALPATWPLDEKSLTAENSPWYWPMEWLKNLARLPSEYDTFLGSGHTVPAGGPLGPGCNFTGFMLVPLMIVDESADGIDLTLGEKAVAWLQLIPLYDDEMDAALEFGVDELYDAFGENSGDDATLGHLADPSRPSYARFVKKPRKR